ncbi:MAG: HAD-IA family hydrolase [Oscillospiraceae bacterium]|nr:HAD-IA family hydrolase [Oscillospiraceae bacterium]
MDFKHIIWDFDGTLFDVYPHAARAFQIVLKREYGVMENVLEIEEQMRISMHRAYSYYKEKYELDHDFFKTFEEYRDIYENQNITPYNNTFMLCKFIYEQGAMNYLLTDRNRTAVSVLQKHGFYELFEDCVTSEDCPFQSPSADGLVFLLEKNKIDKHDALYIGDKEEDLQAARTAGVRFCFFTEDVNHKANNADYTVQNFSDLYYIINSSLSTRKD